MDEAELRSDLATGETPSIEFKRCGNSVGRDTFETICSFANSFGGSIYLGVEDDGNAIGIPEENIVPVKRNVTNVVHNPNVFDPPATLEFEDIVFEGSSLVRIWIPPSPSIHRYKGRIFERIEDADVVVSTESQLTALCVRKQNIYTEQRVFPYVEASDLRMDLLPAIRTMATGKRTRHPWNGMTDEDLLHSAGLFGKNFVTGEKGFNLAAVLLLGDADVIRSLCPSYKTDAVVRISDQDRYDDRVIVTSNLIEAFDQLTGFCTKHLPDRFHLEGSVRVSPRDIIVREVISNMLVHREYTSPFPAKLIIDNERLRTENASRAPFMGRITLSDFNPIPKNPLIGAFFNNIGLAEELGSGTRNLYKYTKVYSGAEPVSCKTNRLGSWICNGFRSRAQGSRPQNRSARTGSTRPTGDAASERKRSGPKIFPALKPYSTIDRKKKKKRERGGVVSSKRSYSTRIMRYPTPTWVWM